MVTMSQRSCRSGSDRAHSAMHPSRSSLASTCTGWPTLSALASMSIQASRSCTTTRLTTCTITFSNGTSCSHGATYGRRGWSAASLVGSPTLAYAAIPACPFSSSCGPPSRRRARCRRPSAGRCSTCDSHVERLALVTHGPRGSSTPGPPPPPSEGRRRRCCAV